MDISTDMSSIAQPIFDTDAMLTEEQRSVFIEVVEESLRVSQRSHLFNWLQRGMQYLIGHEVLMFGIKSEDDVYDYEYLTSSRYFTDTQFNQVLDANTGIVKKALAQWSKKQTPVFATKQETLADFHQYSLIQLDEEAVQASELKEFVVHGFGNARASSSSVVVFGRLNAEFNEKTAYLLSLLMPYIHCALVKVTSSKVAQTAVTNKLQLSKRITKREAEVLQWLYMGKTNWEISNILNISPLTVKNHVQNIIRKLNVENRSQAAAKAAKIGLIAGANPTMSE